MHKKKAISYNLSTMVFTKCYISFSDFVQLFVQFYLIMIFF